MLWRNLSAKHANEDTKLTEEPAVWENRNEEMNEDVVLTRYFNINLTVAFEVEWLVDEGGVVRHSLVWVS